MLLDQIPVNLTKVLRKSSLQIGLGKTFIPFTVTKGCVLLLHTGEQLQSHIRSTYISGADEMIWTQ